MLVAGVGFAIMGAFVKSGAQRFSSTELVFYRSVCGFISIAAMVYWQGKPLRSPLIRKQMGRALTGFIALLLFFYAIAHLPLATAITLNYTSPMFLALLSPWLLTSEQPLSRWQQNTLNLCVVGGFIGVTLLLHPRWEADLWLAGAVGLLSGLGAALAYVHVKQLGAAGEPDWRTVFYFTLVCSIASGGLMLNSQVTPLHWQDLPLLLGLGISATISQLAMTRAYRTGQTLTVASLAYSTIVFATMIGVFWWGERLSWLEYIGMALIILSGVASSRASSPRR
ncbi:Permease of the drug/metabolite transporter (DMT) superfamily [Methylophilus rhizosphaerae]|uniref:Permease of the drug/metabolite transporter (DMT) superfamily n=2 Tax=Methylophilus rhizosphaerae TaxID=492660 RepID=A0A1G9AVD3_9PROT|nr:Permease of the drug/metabolite transporter (DMT) superfamily [Methylophilus rhizosphaerae]